MYVTFLDTDAKYGRCNKIYLSGLEKDQPLKHVLCHLLIVKNMLKVMQMWTGPTSASAWSDWKYFCWDPLNGVCRNF